MSIRIEDTREPEEPEDMWIEKQILRDIASSLRYHAQRIKAMPGISMLTPASRGIEAILEDAKKLEDLTK